MSEVKRRNTPWQIKFAARQLRQALEQVLPDAGVNTAELLMAQVWLETGRGKSVQNNSPGNITSSAKTGDFWRPTWYVVTRKSSARDIRLNKLMLKGKAPRAFRSYQTPESGFLHYLQFLKSPRYEPLLDAAAAGDVAAFARAVRDTGYCPDCDPKKTEPTFRALREEFRRKKLFSELGGISTTKKLVWAAFVAVSALVMKVCSR
jgi:hypothetical protein